MAKLVNWWRTYDNNGPVSTWLSDHERATVAWLRAILAYCLQPSRQ